MDAVDQINHDRALQHNLALLRQESISAIAVLVIAIAYVWLWFDIWPVTGSKAPLSSWIGPTALMIGGLMGYRLRKTHLAPATHFLVLAMLIGTTAALITFPFSSLTDLFLLPVIFASVLLDLSSVALIAVGSSLIVIVISPTLTPAGNSVLLPISMIALTAFALWLSAHHLHTTLIWFYNAYGQAHQNEQLARERQAEMRRLLRALDDATFRLERMNYSLTLERNQAREAHRLKQQFAQTISHELRTPLNLIVAFTEMMAQSPEYYGAPLAPAYVRDLSIVHRNARHLQNLVNDVLDLARIEAAQMTIIPERTEPAALVQEAITTARSLIEWRGLKLCVEVEPDLPELWIDPTRIRQVLFNLLSNAVRFTDQGSISVRVHQSKQEVIFSVEDTGIGIAAEDIPRLFRDFQQLDGTTRRRHGGAGLGLAISRRFVELHKGRIWVNSEPGKGSIFCFTLPITDQQPVAPGNRSRWRLTGDEPIQMPINHNILLAITHNLAALEGLTAHSHDYRTVIASSLEHGKRMAQRLLPQCILIDTVCEPLDTGSVRQLAEDWNMPQTPFLVCDLPVNHRFSRPLNVDGYLVKPFSIQKLSQALYELADDPHCVLVIDDDQDFVRLLSRMLDTPRHRCQVIGAYSGDNGLALLETVRPDLILVDINLPEWGGERLVNAIRNHPDLPPRPIMAILSEDETMLTGTLSQPLIVTQCQGLETRKLAHLLRYFASTQAALA